jgi:hypothetical protein
LLAKVAHYDIPLRISAVAAPIQRCRYLASHSISGNRINLARRPDSKIKTAAKVSIVAFGTAGVPHFAAGHILYQMQADFDGAALLKQPTCIRVRTDRNVGATVYYF